MVEQEQGPFEALQSAIAKLSRTRLNYWAEFAVDIPFGAVLIFAGLRGEGPGFLAACLAVLSGLFLYSIIEYSFHRWLFHGPVRILELGHRAHHENPLGYDSLPFFLPILVLSAFTGALALLMPAHLAFLLVGTIALNYDAYGLWHFTLHHHRFQYAPLRNWAAPHHIHHYHPDANFGVTSPLWDIVLGTQFIYKKGPSVRTS
jgi:4-hydroxysphinganine ceramide fatty acyl 2-hydroxylase